MPGETKDVGKSSKDIARRNLEDGLIERAGHFYAKSKKKKSHPILPLMCGIEHVKIVKRREVHETRNERRHAVQKSNVKDGSCREKGLHA